MSLKIRLGVNIDHIATLRKVRKTSYPDPVQSLPLLQKCGVDQVTCHLREDRRHIQDRDLERIIKSQTLPVNMEMALTKEMVEICRRLRPATCTLVPEKRKEITTEGGLDCRHHFEALKREVPRLREKGIRFSLFIDPDLEQIDLSAELQADGVELHTGTFCEAFGTPNESQELIRLKKAAEHASGRGLKVFAGHGLNTENLPPVVTIKEIEEYNIGHSIISRAVFVGLEEAIREIQRILNKQ